MSETPNRRPYDAKHVQIVDAGTIVTAVWIGDPELAKDPAATLDGPHYWGDDVEVVAEATRFYKRDGADFSGWVVRSGLDYTDPIPNKPEAMEALRDTIERRFAR